MKNLEALLRMKVETPDGVKYTPNFRVAVQEVRDEGVRIIIHASGHDSTTLDFIVRNNLLLQGPFEAAFPTSPGDANA